MQPVVCRALVWCPAARVEYVNFRLEVQIWCGGVAESIC